MYQIIRTVLSNPEDKTELRLLYASRTPDDILLRSELDKLAAEHPKQFRVQYFVDRATSHPTSDPECALRVGRFDADAIQQFLLPPTSPRSAVLVCGPPGMMQHLCGAKPRSGEPAQLGGLLRKVGYGRQVLRFD